MIYLVLIIYFFVLYNAIGYSIRMENSVKVIFLFALFATVYYIGIPIEMLIRGSSLGAYGLVINERTQLIIFSMGILSIVGFSIGYLLSGFRVNEIYPEMGSAFNKFKLSILIVGLIFIILLFGLFHESLLTSASSYAGNALETYINPLYAYLKEMLFYCLAFFISIYGIGNMKRKLVAFILTFILIFFGFLTSDKDPLLIAVLGWGIPFFYGLTRLKLQKVRVYFLVFFLATFLIPLSTLFFSVYRADHPSAFLNRLKMNGLYIYSDAAGPMESLVEAIDDPNIELKLGSTYYWGFIGWIPKSIWPNRPLDLSEKFAKEKIKNCQPGQGLGFSLLTEAYINFGVAGALIQYFVIGLLIGLMGKLFQWIFREPISSFVFFIWMSYSIAIMHRGPFNLPSTYLRFVLPILSCYYLSYFSIIIWEKWKAKKIV
ncbi:hypothetical protein CYCD_29340 [Tenuifilaceae bacterium CYCD]|nr:hypothetical protein CYCD_29340 [Tenuifilaceae bacterium CYCD]